MKKMLILANAAHLAGEIRKSAAAILIGTALLIAGWAATTPLRAQTPSPTPDYEGASDPKKCTICHVPPGNPPNAHTITVGCSAVQAHLKNHPGDCLGPCPCQPTPVTNP
jgi:hypothetical protein